MSQAPSIFRQYYSADSLVDRFLSTPAEAVDVIIPIVHTNELWLANLRSIYRQIPVNRLLLGDGGCIDDSMAVAQQFPRVTVFDHRHYTSLGFSLRKLIEEVRTPWFVYLHSDVYLPPGWFEAMIKHRSDYDWFECRQHLTVLVDYPMDYTNYHRPLSGSQMGRRAAFDSILPLIEDDYLYRNEDLIYADLLQEHGFRYGRVDETFHYHQMMNKDSAWARKIKRVDFDIEKSTAEEEREFTMQVHGLIKYTRPKPEFVGGVQAGLQILVDKYHLRWPEFLAWVQSTNPAWLPYLRRRSIKKKTRDLLYRWYRRLFGG